VLPNGREISYTPKWGGVKHTGRVHRPSSPAVVTFKRQCGATKRCATRRRNTKLMSSIHHVSGTVKRRAARACAAVRRKPQNVGGEGETRGHPSCSLGICCACRARVVYPFQRKSPGKMISLMGTSSVLSKKCLPRSHQDTKEGTSSTLGVLVTLWCVRELNSACGKPDLIGRQVI